MSARIMEQIRRRIRDKRGVDYTEAQVRELATVRLEKFLDAKNLRSDLFEQFRKSRPADDVELPRGPTSSRTPPSTTRTGACCEPSAACSTRC